MVTLPIILLGKVKKSRLCHPYLWDVMFFLRILTIVMTVVHILFIAIVINDSVTNNPLNELTMNFFFLLT